MSIIFEPKLQFVSSASLNCSFDRTSHSTPILFSIWSLNQTSYISGSSRSIRNEDIVSMFVIGIQKTCIASSFPSQWVVETSSSTVSRSQYVSTGCYKWQGINTIDDLAGSRTVRAFSYWISTTQRAVEKNGGGRDGPSRWGNDPNYKDQDSSYWNWYFLGTVTWGVFLRAENSLG